MDPRVEPAFVTLKDRIKAFPPALHERADQVIAALDRTPAALAVVELAWSTRFDCPCGCGSRNCGTIAWHTVRDELPEICLRDDGAWWDEQDLMFEVTVRLSVRLHRAEKASPAAARERGAA